MTALEKNILDSIQFKVTDHVYLVTDDDQKKRIVTAILIKQFGVLYELAQGVTTSWHYGFEITSEVNVKVKTEN